MAAVHSRAIRAAGGSVVAATASSADRAHLARKSTGARHAAASVRELVQREDIDVVHVCSPNAVHQEHAVQALEAGKWLVCEKPLATSVRAAESILDASTCSGLGGSVPFVYRFHPMVREMRARIAAGALGAPSVIHGSYLQDWLAAENATNWRVDPRLGGRSRAFADIGSHWFDLLEFVTGDRVTRVSAQGLTAFPQRNGGAATTEDAVSVQFATEGGAIGAMVVSQVSAGRKNRLHLEISGSDASFAFDQEQPESLWHGSLPGATQLARDGDQLAPDAARLSLLPPGHPQGYQDAFNAFVADSHSFFAGTLGPEAQRGLPQLQDGLRAAEICDAVLDSVDSSGSWVETTSALRTESESARVAV
ncbi:Gfo/Idh/MocA family oxidoreductase [Isoptericola hypogeus]|uniref:Gfo/Idh/MocA family oxidoreductase n=2 Tax=Isoptericola hypogeus TaxID=300179 RepID=A0ABN2JWV0_9MICO